MLHQHAEITPSQAGYNAPHWQRAQEAETSRIAKAAPARTLAVSARTPAIARQIERIRRSGKRAETR